LPVLASPSMIRPSAFRRHHELADVAARLGFWL
jgi:hypothetical protein